MLLKLCSWAALALMLAACDGGDAERTRSAPQVDSAAYDSAGAAAPNLAAPIEAVPLASADAGFEKSFSVEMNRQHAERRTHGDSAEPVQQPYGAQ